MLEIAEATTKKRKVRSRATSDRVVSQSPVYRVVTALAEKIVAPLSALDVVGAPPPMDFIGLGVDPASAEEDVLPVISCYLI